MHNLLPRSAALVLALALAGPVVGQAVGGFEVRLDESAFPEPFTGALFVAFAKEGEPLQAMHGWFNAPPVVRFEVEGARGGDALVLRLEDAAAHHPVHWSEVDAGEWTVQAIARKSATGRRAGHGEGDVVGAPVVIEYEADAEGNAVLTLGRVVGAEPFEESERLRLFEHVSPALSEFHGFPYTVRAGVLLPVDHDPEQRYPVVYSVTGFGGGASSIRGWQRMAEGTVLDQCIVVVPDASNRYGHSVFCDSRSIGPWGHALVHELIPALEEEYGGAGAAQRYVTGVSSGGWSSLWLQVEYPEHFAGCWSHVPDPIDFHDFQQIDLYTSLEDGSPRNMYVDEEGELRPVARLGGGRTMNYRDFVQREHVLNPGGQIRSFEATFSAPDTNGEPQRVFDVETGAVNHEVASTWRRYDISHRLLTEWDALQPRLDGKVHVYAGEVDTFYLEGAVERFRGLAEEAGLLEHMTIIVEPGMRHTRHRAGHANMLAAIARGLGVD